MKTKISRNSRQKVYYQHRKAVKSDIVSLGETCTMCGVKAPEELRGFLLEHHKDYNKPLETITLCFSCHMKLHWEGKSKKDRDARLYKFWLEHPTMSLQKIGNVFHIKHRQQVHRIIKGGKSE